PCFSLWNPPSLSLTFFSLTHKCMHTPPHTHTHTHTHANTHTHTHTHTDMQPCAQTHTLKITVRMLPESPSFPHCKSLISTWFLQLQRNESLNWTTSSFTPAEGV